MINRIRLNDGGQIIWSEDREEILRQRLIYYRSGRVSHYALEESEEASSYWVYFVEHFRVCGLTFPCFEMAPLVEPGCEDRVSPILDPIPDRAMAELTRIVEVGEWLLRPVRVLIEAVLLPITKPQVTSNWFEIRCPEKEGWRRRLLDVDLPVETIGA